MGEASGRATWFRRAAGRQSLVAFTCIAMLAGACGGDDERDAAVTTAPEKLSSEADESTSTSNAEPAGSKEEFCAFVADFEPRAQEMNTALFAGDVGRTEALLAELSGMFPVFVASAPEDLQDAARTQVQYLEDFFEMIRRFDFDGTHLADSDEMQAFYDTHSRDPFLSAGNAITAYSSSECDMKVGL